MKTYFQATSFHSFATLLLFIFFGCQTVISQIVVNKKLVETFGRPSSILDEFEVPFTEFEWASSKIHGQELYTTGHTVINQNEVSILTTKQDEFGTVVWQKQYSPSGASTYKSFGIEIEIDSSGNVFVIGGLTYTDQDSFDYVILKYSSTGVLLWERTYNGSGNGMDIPADLILDTKGNPILTGTSMGLITGLDYLTLKLNSSNGNTVWEERYDHNGFDDIAVKIEISVSGDIVATGTSASSLSDWDFASLKYDESTGSEIVETRIEDASLGIETPTNLASDALGNLYLIGNSKVGTGNQDMQLAKLDSQLAIVWTVSYDGGFGLDDAANAVQVDAEGNVYVLGHSRNGVGNHDLKLLKYDTSGVLLWTSGRFSEKNDVHVKGYRLSINDENEIYAAGRYIVSERASPVVIKFDDKGAVVWSEVYKEALGEDVYPLGLNVDNDDETYVFLLTLDSDTSRYEVLRMREHTKNDSTAVDPSGESPYRTNQVIAKFAKDKLILNNVNDLNVVHADPSFFLNDAGLKDLATVINLRDLTFIRIFKRLTTGYTSATSRQGKSVPVGEFWAAFILEYKGNLNPYDFSDSLEVISETVLYAHPNLVATLSCTADDTEYSDQESLQATSMSFEGGDIEVEDAWCEETGENYVKVGVFDTYLWWPHQDFGYDGSDPESSIVAGGWRFLNNSPLKGNPNYQDNLHHGTQVGGIIGAVRNNNLDVAGIAGGDAASNKTGVSLYGLEPNFAPTTDVQLAQTADAWLYSALDEGEDYAFGLHIMNTSMNFYINQNEFPEVYQLAIDVLEQVQRLGVSFFASRGNITNSPGASIPAAFEEAEDYWVNSVAGVDEFGSPYGANYGIDVDFAGPAETANQRTLIQDNGTSTFSGTSSASPHAAGIAALLMSYYNAPGPDCRNLAPEDIEWVMENSADDVFQDPSIPGPDEHTGHGLVQADDAIDLVKKPERDIMHFSLWVSECYQIGGSFTGLGSPIEEDIPLELSEPVTSIDYQIEFNDGNYLADVYKVGFNATHQIPSNLKIINYWPRHSVSTTFLPHVGGSLRPHFNISLDQLDHKSATLTGYAYHLKDLDGNSLGWIPYDISGPLAFAYQEIGYSVLVEDPFLTNDEKVAKPQFQSWPNPASEQIWFSFPAGLEIENLQVYDSTGKKLEGLDIDFTIESVEINLRTLPPGMYFCQFTTENGTFSQSFVKM